MSDIQLTIDPTALWAQIEAQHAARTRLAEEALPRNKAALFDALAAVGITSVVVTFDGVGDSGQIESIDAGIDGAPTELAGVDIEIDTPAYDGSGLDRRTCALPEAIENLAYAFLEETHGGGKTTRARSASSFSPSPSERSRLITTSGSKRPNITATSGEEEMMGHCYHHALSTGRVVPERLIGEQHVVENLGFVPSFADWVRCIRPEPWMGRAQPIHKLIDPFAVAASEAPTIPTAIPVLQVVGGAP